MIILRLTHLQSEKLLFGFIYHPKIKSNFPDQALDIRNQL